MGIDTKELLWLENIHLQISLLPANGKIQTTKDTILRLKNWFSLEQISF